MLGIKQLPDRNKFWGISERWFLKTYGQRHAKRDLRTYANSVDPDQSPRLRRRVWSGSALFDNRNINGTYCSCYVNNFIMFKCFQHRIGADLGLHYVECPKGPFSRDAGHMENKAFASEEQLFTFSTCFQKYLKFNFGISILK